MAKIKPYSHGDSDMEVEEKEPVLLANSPSIGVALLKLNRPKQLNALNNALLKALAEQVELANQDEEVRVIVITGSETVFAAGADINEMSELDMQGVMFDQRVGYWEKISASKKPMIAVINGYAFGGGCELAMHADILIAGENATFAQPEIKLGIMPGAGGTQRLVKAVGKSLAMQMTLTGEPINAQQALRSGLISEICIPEQSLERGLQVASIIAGQAKLAVTQIKQSIDNGFETDLKSGLAFERQAFCLLAGTEDRNEGLNAFKEKRKPIYKGR